MVVLVDIDSVMRFLLVASTSSVHDEIAIKSVEQRCIGKDIVNLTNAGRVHIR